ncbi:hypothetical protein EJB05_45334, partial [Eragrostis curvula]
MDGDIVQSRTARNLARDGVLFLAMIYSVCVIQRNCELQLQQATAVRIATHHFDRLVVIKFLPSVVVITLATILLLKATQLGPIKLVLWLHVVCLCHLPPATVISFFLGTLYIMHRPHSIYLVDYACFRHTSDCRTSRASFIEHVRQMPSIDDKSVQFMTRMLENSGLGDQTYRPLTSHYIPPYQNLSVSREEAEQVIFSSIDDLFAKTCTSPDEIDILVTNCSAFNPTPSFFFLKESNAILG